MKVRTKTRNRSHKYNTGFISLFVFMSWPGHISDSGPGWK